MKHKHTNIYIGENLKHTHIFHQYAVCLYFHQYKHATTYIYIYIYILRVIYKYINISILTQIDT